MSRALAALELAALRVAGSAACHVLSSACEGPTAHKLSLMFAGLVPWDAAGVLQALWAGIPLPAVVGARRGMQVCACALGVVPVQCDWWGGGSSSWGSSSLRFA